ncbi:dephospho-CoA kinase [Arcobacter sp. FWKO B]|uniref:dephospho-CoA kinase n=1 Tax=Arcobacter sp. FWKO B TaxID=2593672 RepID=UPI0018A5C935|nr:dephospho-CoA kinase [Arcobacter sp. FWKO B]QOG12138.1 dephospho-CoA kinase [Arcobacter sp. FWKO B]
MQEDNFKYAIALTGGIGTGKSTVSKFFMLYGFLIIDADELSREILSQNIDFVKVTFGEEYINQDGTIDRKKLGSLIFSNDEERKKLENFLHPLIKKAIIKKAEIFEKAQKPYLIDIPLFFETKNYDIKKSIVVYATPELQLQRIIQRDGLSDIEAKKRIKSQMNIDDKKALATFVIDNTQDLKHLQKEVERVIHDITKI